MDYFLRFVHPLALYILIPGLVIICCIRAYWHRSVVYRYPLVSLFINKGMTASTLYQKIIYLMRTVALLTLAFLIGKPQIVDSHSNIKVEGIDIVMAIDVSGSMQVQDDADDERSRIDIAKAEAIRFIEKRTNDAIGLVIFGQDAVSRCPLTLDKLVLKDIVQSLSIGVLNPQGTVLATALITAANRLKNSKAKSKVIILLTDGEPTDGDIVPEVAIEAAKKLGIKVYTIGIGSDKVRNLMHPIFGTIAIPGVNTQLLTVIAQQTGGKFFMARNAKDMRVIYDTIDTLEKTVNETPVFSNYWDIFVPFVWVVIVLMILELVLSSFMWFGL